MSLKSINPATDELVREYPEPGDKDLAMILAEASCAAAGWRRTSFADRAPKMRRAADLLDERKEELARLMAIEMGKPLAGGRSEAEKCAWVCRYYADNAERFLAPEVVATDAGKSFVAFLPLGPVLAIMPWNFPFWQVFRFAAPALMAGNAGLLKHAGNVSGCALAIEQIFKDAGFPPPLFRALLVQSKRVEAIIASPAVKAVTLTGSTPAGRAVAAKAGAMIKKTVLELGGSDPYLVLEDADLESASETCVAARLINSGQSCIAAKRFIVVEPVRKRFEELFVEKMPRADLRDGLHRQVEASVRAGARMLLGGKAPAGRGAFYPPTVLTGVSKGMPAFDEELFGPVAAIIAAKDEADAVMQANDSPFGLGAAVFTRDVKRGERIATEELEAGSCFVNALVKSDPRLPFGGIKESGYGRELSVFGIREFVNVKTVYVK
ncbi:MAG: succinate-semialdehyde dehydrogenase [Acidobacteria bacterium]|nr:MAG: succinate-semialdehyde dehydrogenase [Acidobacteriota bacterium]